MTVAFSHVGICVSDIDRSMRFYCEGLGFVPAETHTVGNEFARLMELDGDPDGDPDGDLVLQSQFIARDGVRIELLQFHSPGHEWAARRAFNTLGLTHLSLLVEDIDDVATTIFGLGGEVLMHTRTQLAPDLDFVYCTDPDGTRIELMRLPSTG